MPILISFELTIYHIKYIKKINFKNFFEQFSFIKALKNY